MPFEEDNNPGAINSPPSSPNNDLLPLSPAMKKSASMYLNVRMPQKRLRPNVEGTTDVGEGSMSGDSLYDPTEKVQDLINKVKDPKYKTRQLFVEMDVLTQRGEDMEWREFARWVKYEEKVEEGGKRWSKPHVASLNMHYLMELRGQILDGVFLKDMECYSISQVVGRSQAVYHEVTGCISYSHRLYILQSQTVYPTVTVCISNSHSLYILLSQAV
ncbi:electroneutral sodium bicarbonate exchanger 1 [Biomphalaria glabrata]